MMNESVNGSDLIRGSDWRSLPRIEGPGGEKLLPVSKVVDILINRAMLISEGLIRPGLGKRETEYLRGQIAEIRLLYRALTDRAPGPIGLNL